MCFCQELDKFFTNSKHYISASKALGAIQLSKLPEDMLSVSFQLIKQGKDFDYDLLI